MQLTVNLNTMKETIEHVIDGETGVVLQTTIESVRYKTNRPYVKVYIDDSIDSLILLSKMEHALLYYCFQIADFNNEFPFTKVHKERLSQRLSLTIRTIDNALVFLIKSGLVIRIARGYFKLNPHYFSKGKDKPITELA